MPKTKEIQFTKYHGLGNDFLVTQSEGLPRDYAALARAITARHTGVGADGLLVLSKPRSGVNSARLRFFNADGSEAEMSGNGIRCAGVFLMEQGAAKSQLRIETAAGVRQLDLVSSGNGEWRFRVAMGAPILDPDRIPVIARKRRAPLTNFPLRIGKFRLAATITSMGNPHCSIFVRDFSSIPWQKVGAEIENSNSFPNRTNVEFVRVMSKSEIEVRYWERGVGYTQSSGTGSCAASVASILNGFTARTITVSTVAGELEVSWPEGGEVFLTGPAGRVAKGAFFL